MIDKSALVDARLSRVLTQYRESPNLLGVAGAYLSELTDVMDRADAIPSAFDMDTSTGDQLTIIGRWLGFPRTHGEGARVRAFGFERLPPVLTALIDNDNAIAVDNGEALVIETDRTEARQAGFDLVAEAATTYSVAGFCEGAFFACPDGTAFEEHTFSDDDTYRRWLKARRRQINASLSLKYTRQELETAAGEIFGATAKLVKEKPGIVTVCLERLFTEAELRLLELASLVLPVPPGIAVEWAHSDGTAFGFGEGWGETCSSSFYGVIRSNLNRKPKSDVFGFGPDFSGLCEGFFYSGNPQDLE